MFKSPDTILAKTRRSECLDVVLTKTGVETSTQKSLIQKRQGGDADLYVTSDENFTAKKRRHINRPNQ